MTNTQFTSLKPDFSDGILLNHNKNMYKMIVQGFSKGKKVLFEQATGTGKSYIALKFLKDYAKGKRVLFVSPSYVIRNYFVDVLEEEKKRNAFDFDLDTCLYQGLKQKIDQQYDVIVFDEAHRMGAKTWGPLSQSLLDKNPNALILGMSATLERSDKSDITKYFDGKAPVARFSLVDALKQKVLPSPDYTIAKIDFTDERKEIDKSIQYFKEKRENATANGKKKIDKFLKDLTRAKQTIAKSEDVKSIIEKELLSDGSCGKKFIVFCPVGDAMEDSDVNISKMNDIINKSVEWFGGFGGPVSINCVYSDFGEKRNKLAIENFKKEDPNSIKLLFAINMLNEGLHIGDVDGIVMLRQTGSRIVYLQQLGRGLSAGKDAHLKHPKVLDLVANLDYVDIEKLASIQKGKSDDASEIEDLQEDSIERLFYRLNIEKYNDLKFINKLKEQIFSFKKLNSFEFDNFLDRLLQYKAKFGDVYVPSDYCCDDGYTLGVKIKSIRIGNIKLLESQKNQLSELGFVFDTREDHWNKMYEKLVAYVKQMKTLPSKGRSALGNKLAAWVGGQRSNRAKLDANKIELLGRLGVWEQESRQQRSDRVWRSKFEILSDFVASKGCLPQGVEKKAIGIHSWLQDQRRRQASGKLEKDRYDLLGSVGFWEKLPQSEIEKNIWYNKFALVADFLKTSGRWPTGRLQSEKTLASWLKDQRRRGVELEEDRYNALAELGFWQQPTKKEVLDAKWDVMLAKVELFLSAHGTWPGYGGDDDETDLANWLSKQRARAKENKLLKERYDALEKLGFWETKSRSEREKDGWNETYNLIYDFVNVYGYLPRYNAGDKEARRIYAWIRRNITNFDYLTPEKQEKLTTLLKLAKTEIDVEDGAGN